MNTNNKQKVLSVNGRLQAIWVESILVNAGVPVSFCTSKDGAYLDVLVSDEKVNEATILLNPELNIIRACCVPAAF